MNLVFSVLGLGTTCNVTESNYNIKHLTKPLNKTEISINIDINYIV